MTINKQFYEDACKLIEQPNAWVQRFNFGKNGEGMGYEIFTEVLPLIKGEANCWCMNGALVQVIMGKDEQALKRWFDGHQYDADGNVIADPEAFTTFYEHQSALHQAFKEHTDQHEGFVYYNDFIAKSGQDMANKVREIVAKMEG